MHRLGRITLKQLRALATVAETGTIAAAAESLGLTGPAVHNQLKSLEEAIGARLFERTADGPRSVTPQAQALLRAAAEIDGTLTRTLSEIDALNAGACGTVSLGVVSTAKYFAPAMVAMLEKEMPGIILSLTIGNRGEILQALSRLKFDLCVMGRPPRLPLVTARRIGPHPHVIIAPPDHPLAHRARVEPEELAGERFVIRESGSGTRILAERVLADIADGRELATIEMASNETIKQAVMSGLGIALISAHTVTAELQEGRLVTLKVRGTPIERAWFLATPKGRELSPAANRVREWMLDAAPRFLPNPPI